MGFSNAITVISETKELIEKISGKLVLLRDLDKITSAGFFDTVNLLKNALPNVIVIHCNKNDARAINLVKEIRADFEIQNIPILFVAQDCTPETVVDAFDAGITDVLTAPFFDHELLIRTIWCIKKNELTTNIETQNDFLKKIGVIQSETGVYTQKFSDDFLACQIKNASKYKANSCVMVISPDSKYPNYKNPKDFLGVIQNSIRLNDAIAIKDMDEFYIFLPKTKLNGAYPVFERINNNLGVDCGANGAVIEIAGHDINEIKELLDTALKKAKSETNSLIVAQNAYLEEPDLSINPRNMHSVNKEIQTIHSSAAADDRNSKLYRSAYKQKCAVVIEPVFKKYKNLICSKSKDVKADFRVNLDKTAFAMSKGKTMATLTIAYNGVYKIKVDTRIIYENGTRAANSAVVDFLQLDFKRLSQILEDLYGEFKNYIKTAETVENSAD